MSPGSSRTPSTSSALPLDPNGIYFVLGSADVSATGFCSGLCQFHDHTLVAGTSVKYAFIGNADRCPQQCALQFFGKRGRPLGSPNENLGADAMASWMAHVLVGAAERAAAFAEELQCAL